MKITIQPCEREGSNCRSDITYSGNIVVRDERGNFLPKKLPYLSPFDISYCELAYNEETESRSEQYLSSYPINHRYSGIGLRVQ